MGTFCEKTTTYNIVSPELRKDNNELKQKTRHIL